MSSQVMITLNCTHFWTTRSKRLPVRVKIANMHTTQTVPREECIKGKESVSLVSEECIKGKQSWTAYNKTCLLNSWIPNLSDPWFSTRMLDYSWEAPVILKEASPFILDSMFSEKKNQNEKSINRTQFRQEPISYSIWNCKGSTQLYSISCLL